MSINSDRVAASADAIIAAIDTAVPAIVDAVKALRDEATEENQLGGVADKLDAEAAKLAAALTPPA